jgi:hypothetical protein
MLRLLVLLAALLPLTACDGAEPEPTLLRIQNIGALTITDVVIEHDGQTVSFGDVETGATSAYQPIEGATSLMSVRLHVEGEPRALVPAHDGYGDRLGSGRFTASINVDSADLTLWSVESD